MEEIDGRKKEILRAVIREHILTAEPIGSRTLAKNYDLGVSSATIRNEMADLEDMGYLEQPHTSAGRIPSDRGYRYYVDVLMEQNLGVPAREMEQLFDQFDREKRGIQEVISSMVNMLSKLTRYTVMISEPRLLRSKINKLELVNLASGNLMVVLITDTGLIHNKTIKLEDELSTRQLRYLNQFLISKLKGRELTSLNKDYIEGIERELMRRINLSHEIFSLINSEIERITRPEDLNIYLAGTSYILEQPEFNDLEILKKVLKIFDHKEVLRRLIENAPNQGLEVKIGQENIINDMKNCSIVFSTYSLNDRAVGKIGVIGPTRMQYPRVISTVDFVSEVLSKIISEVSR